MSKYMAWIMQTSINQTIFSSKGLKKKKKNPPFKMFQEKILVLIGLTLKVEKLKYPHDNYSVSFNDEELTYLSTEKPQLRKILAQIMVC